MKKSMRAKTTATLLLVLLVLVSCAPKEISRVEKFSFVFEEDSCGSLPLLNVLDTSTGVLIHTPLEQTEPVEIPFVLTGSEMKTIYQNIILSDFFDYPSEVRLRGEGSTFRLKVINGDLANDVTVTWTSTPNSAGPILSESNDLLELYILVQQIIRSHPEYPESTTACA
jgi:hypothetical protein